jgi:thiol-disulfide isomerase/thioredoxin
MGRVTNGGIDAGGMGRILAAAGIIVILLAPAAWCRNAPPTAAFERSAAPAALLAVTFDASSSADPEDSIERYLWTFGDGASGSGQTVTHRYAASGFYIVTLMVVDDRGVRDTLAALVDLSEPTGIYPLGIAVGEAAPAFSLPDLAGRSVELAAFRGRVIILEFWASWCKPCHAAMDELAQLAEGANGEVQILAVSLDRHEEALRLFLDGKSGDHLMVLWGSRERADDVKALYGVGEIPYLVVLDRRGVIRFRGHFRDFDGSVVTALLE